MDSATSPTEARVTVERLTKLRDNPLFICRMNGAEATEFAADLALLLALLKEAGKVLKPIAAIPAHGKHGGSFVIMSASYEDMRKGDSAPRAAHLHWPQIEAAAKLAELLPSMEGE